MSKKNYVSCYFFFLCAVFHFFLSLLFFLQINEWNEKRSLVSGDWPKIVGQTRDAENTVYENGGNRRWNVEINLLVRLCTIFFGAGLFMVLLRRGGKWGAVVIFTTMYDALCIIRFITTYHVISHKIPYCKKEPKETRCKRNESSQRNESEKKRMEYSFIAW